MCIYCEFAIFCSIFIIFCISYTTLVLIFCDIILYLLFYINFLVALLSLFCISFSVALLYLFCISFLVTLLYLFCISFLITLLYLFVLVFWLLFYNSLYYLVIYWIIPGPRLSFGLLIKPNFS